MGGLDIADLMSHLAVFMVVLLFAISAHEAGHAWMSWKFGDDTAYMLGRVTLNPVAHTDPIGTLLLPILGFVFAAMGGALATIPLLGWGKPTPVNPRNWKNYKLANVMVSVAGVLANISIAVIAVIILKSLAFAGVLTKESISSGLPSILMLFLWYSISMNISLFIFNLLPFPPLDGSKILSTFLPESFQPVFAFLEQFGFMILLFLMYTGVLRAIVSPIYNLILGLLL